MKRKLQKGDRIVLRKDSGMDDVSYLSLNKEYITESDEDDEGDILIVDDDEEESWLKAEWFDLSDINNNIDYAKSLVGTNVFVKNGNKKPISVSIEGFSVWNKFFDNGSVPAITKLIKKDGYAVTVEDSKGQSILLNEIVQKSNKVVLNDEYTAVIDGDTVQVGCQSFPIEKIEEILEVYNELNN